MNTDRLFVKEYLESLKEKGELSVLFTFWLEAKGFRILSKPTENYGVKEYGKDIIAIGKDGDGVKKKFYFELKGGEDRDINEKMITKPDGISDSLVNAATVEDDYSEILSEDLNKVIVIVHNGIVKGSAARLLDDTFNRVKKLNPEVKFDRWGIEKLVQIFNEDLFGPYLLSDGEIRKKLNRVLINLDSIQEVSNDFVELVNRILFAQEWNHSSKRILKAWKRKFESLKIIGFIVYRESLSHNNVGIAEKYLRKLLLDFWYWVLKNNLENNKGVVRYFDEIYSLHYHVLTEYVRRVLNVAMLTDGLHYPNGGQYEQVGFTLRTHDFISILTYALNTVSHRDPNFSETVNVLDMIIEHNSVSRRPLLDIHSLPIFDAVMFFLRHNEIDKAKHHIQSVLAYLQFSKENSGRMPDASNNPMNVVKLFATSEKPVYYIDETSLLLGMLIEISVVLGAEDLFKIIRDFGLKHEDVEIALFIPHHGNESDSKELIDDLDNDLEEQLFSRSVDDGYQLTIELSDERDEPISFEEFKSNLLEFKNEFTYDYRTDKVGYGILRDLAHFQYKTPYFPDRWRRFLQT